MSPIEAGQLWVSSEPTTPHYVVRVHLGVVFVVPVRIDGVGRDAKVISTGPMKRLPVAEILDTWMPAGMPMKIPRTWHEQLLERLDE